MKQFLLLLLAVLGLVALIPTESKAQLTISIGPGYSDRGYYQRRAYYGPSDGYYYQRHSWASASLHPRLDSHIPFGPLGTSMRFSTKSTEHGRPPQILPLPKEIYETGVH
jgi:hypothetical protein